MSSGVFTVALPTGVAEFCSESELKFGVSVGHGRSNPVDALAASFGAWVTVVLTAAPWSFGSSTADPVTVGENGSDEQPVGLKSGDAVDVSVLFAYAIVIVDDPGEQFVGIRVNGLPPSVPLIVSDICVSRLAVAPRVDRSRPSTTWTLPLDVCTSCPPMCVVGMTPRFGDGTRSIPTRSALAGGGTRYALSDAGTRPSTVALPVPI